MEKCVICGKKARIKIKGNPSFCEKCFARIIEKRIRKYIRLNKLFSKGDKIYANNFFVKFILKNILKDLVSLKKKKKADKIVLSNSADDISIQFLKNLLNGKKPKKKNKKEINILLYVTDKELTEYSKIKKIPFKPKKKDKHIADFLYSMQKKYPETIISLAKAIENIEKFENEKF